MLYWVAVYALISFVVLLPLLLIYLVGCALLLGLRLVGFTIRNNDTALARLVGDEICRVGRVAQGLPKPFARTR